MGFTSCTEAIVRSWTYAEAGYRGIVALVSVDETAVDVTFC